MVTVGAEMVDPENGWYIEKDVLQSITRYLGFTPTHPGRVHLNSLVLVNKRDLPPEKGREFFLFHG